MTCIVGLVDNGRVWMGGDSFCEKGALVYNRVAPKVFFRENPETGLHLLIGTSGEGFVSQVMQFEVEIPPCREDQGGREYIGQELGPVALDAIASRMRLLKHKAWPSFTMLVGYDRGIYSIDHNGFVLHEDSGIIAIGWGEELAMGAMEATPELAPEERIRRALEVASKRTAKVAPPFTIENL